MKNLLTKKNTLFFEIGLASLFIAVFILASSHFCNANKLCASLFDGLRFWNFVSYTIFVFPLLLLSLLTYKMRDEIFMAWMSFAKWWVPLSLVITIFIPSSSGGMIPVAFKFIFSVICSIILFFVSLCVVGWRYNVLKKSRE